MRLALSLGSVGVEGGGYGVTNHQKVGDEGCICRAAMWIENDAKKSERVEHIEKKMQRKEYKSWQAL